MDRKLINSYGSRVTWKRFQKFGSLEVCKQLWQLRGLKRRLPWNFTCADFIKNLVPSKAFTMAEILISLTIIGIIAAITLPALVGSINEKSWATQRKALYSRMSQAIEMLPSLNGYGVYDGSWTSDVVTVTKDTAAQAFVTDGLSKVLQIENICSISANTSSENARKELKKCGISDKIKSYANSKMDFPVRLSELNPHFITHNDYYGWGMVNPQKHIDTLAFGFETKNKESIAVFYNPYCQPSFGETSSYWSFPKMCANFIYDLNGKKGPNKVGKDIGTITALYPTESEVVAPMPVTENYLKNNIGQTAVWRFPATNVCRQYNKGEKQNSRVPNIRELMSIFYNYYLYDWSINGSAGDHVWSNTQLSDTKGWTLFDDGRIFVKDKTVSSGIRCIKKY